MWDAKRARLQNAIRCGTSTGNLQARPTTHTMSPYRDSIIIATTLLTGVAAINNGLAITPPMGWVR
jgi:hypothetical protein